MELNQPTPTLFKASAFAIILDSQNRVLLCHRCDHDLWNLPGGGVEAGEAPWQAVVREVKEETGLTVEVVSLSSLSCKPGQNIIVFTFICRVVSGELTLNDEADKIEYFGLMEIPYNFSSKQLERIKDYFSNPNKVHCRLQQGPPSLEQFK